MALKRDLVSIEYCVHCGSQFQVETRVVGRELSKIIILQLTKTKSMVMADRYVEDIRNGRKYRGASPTNGFSEDSSDEEERGEWQCSDSVSILSFVSFQ